MKDRPLTPHARIESLLFVASAPVPIKRLAKVLNMKAAEVKTVLYELQEHCFTFVFAVVFQKSVDRAEHEGERGAQFMGYIGEEATL